MPLMIMKVGMCFQPPLEHNDATMYIYESGIWSRISLQESHRWSPPSPDPVDVVAQIHALVTSFVNRWPSMLNKNGSPLINNYFPLAFTSISDSKLHFALPAQETYKQTYIYVFLASNVACDGGMRVVDVSWVLVEVTISKWAASLLRYRWPAVRQQQN